MAGNNLINNQTSINQQSVSGNFSSGENTRPIPHDVNAEKSVLSAVILSPESAQDAFLLLKSEYFFRPSHRILYQTMLDMYQESLPIDYITLVDRLNSEKQLEAAGGVEYITSLQSDKYSIMNWEEHAAIVKRTYVLRELIYATAKVSSLAFDAPKDSNEVIFECEKLILDVTREQVKGGFKTLKDLTQETYQELQQRKKEGRRHLGVTSGYKDLDHLLGGFRPGNLVVLAARPGIGKTSLALNIAHRTAQRDNSVAVFSLEMSATELIQRFLSMSAGISSRVINEGTLSDTQWKKISKSSNELSKLPIYLDDTPAANIIEISTKARRQMRDVEPGKGLIIVDYLQLMQPTTHHVDARHVEVAEISRGLKILAKELNQPILALSQLNRAVETRKDRKPMLADLRESGAIEQDADVVMFIDRSMTKEEAQDKNRPDENVAEVIVAKHRNGETGVVKLQYKSAYTLFSPLANKTDIEQLEGSVQGGKLAYNQDSFSQGGQEYVDSGDYDGSESDDDQFS